MKSRRSRRRDNVRHNPWIENTFNVAERFDDFITRDLFMPSFSTTGVSTPAVNIIETNEDFRLQMVAPGMKKEDFNVELQEDVLTVSYDHEDNLENPRRDWKYITREYNYHSFTRSFSLPDTTVPDQMQAKYEGGILNVIIRKREDAKSKPPRQIGVS